MTIDIDKLSDEMLDQIKAKYGLKEVAKKVDENAPSFQVIRGHAIRAAVKSIAKKHNVVQKVVHLYDTHKVNNGEYEVIVGCQRNIYLVVVDNSTWNDPKVKTITVTEKKSF